MALALATIFMALLEECYLANIPLSPHFYVRYIDDIFMIWNHGRPALEAFARGFNDLKLRIKFTCELSANKAVFLDVRVYKGRRFDACKKLHTNTSTTSHTYIHGRSHHSPHVYEAVACNTPHT